MRLASLYVDGTAKLVAVQDDGLFDLTEADESLGTDVGALIASGSDWLLRARGALPLAPRVDGITRYRPLVPQPPKVLCLGLNDVDHAAEANLPVPDFPAVFTRVSSSLIGHREPMLRPVESLSLDYEVELAVVVGRGGRRIPVEDALRHVAGYTVFNDGTVREYQLQTSQWTLGKNFHGTGALGPHLVTADELPAGAKGLRMTTCVGDELLQDGDTAKMIFGVAETIALLSQAMVLEPGDVIAMGTPSGIGHARSPRRYLLPGETCVAAIEGIGELRSPVVDDAPMVARAAE